jgi:hypothetical protein
MCKDRDARGAMAKTAAANTRDALNTKAEIKETRPNKKRYKKTRANDYLRKVFETIATRAVAMVA